VDSTCTSSLLPLISNENPDSHLLSVDECEPNEPVTTLQQQYPLTRKRSSTGSGQHLVRYREQNSKKLFVVVSGKKNFFDYKYFSNNTKF